MVRKNIKRPRLNSRKRRRDRYYKELDEKRVLEGGAVSVPEPTADQKQYVEDLVEWRESSYQPGLIVGGPQDGSQTGNSSPQRSENEEG